MVRDQPAIGWLDDAVKSKVTGEVTALVLLGELRTTFTARFGFALVDPPQAHIARQQSATDSTTRR